MKDKDQVKAEFLADLNELLLKYGAEITAEEHIWSQEKIRISVDIDGVWDKEGNKVSDGCFIDLGRCITGSPKSGKERNTA